MKEWWLSYIIAHSENSNYAYKWAYWWLENRRYFPMSRELWLEEQGAE